MKVLLADKFASSGLAALRDMGCQVFVEPKLEEEALREALERERPEVLIVRGTVVDERHLEASPELALVIRAGAGVNTIALDAASARGTYVANCPGRNAIAVAELALAHILALDRRLVDGACDLREGKWNKKLYQKARGLFGRKLGVLGVGRIGEAVISRAQAFGMEVVAWSRSLTPEHAAVLQVKHAGSPLDVARQCDILTIHLAIAPETKNLVDAEVLGALPEGALLVNTARAQVVDQGALEEAIRTRGLRAGLDVFNEEPAAGTGTLEPGIFALPGVQGTHHIGASTEQAQEAVAEEAVRIVRTFHEEGVVPNCVNLAHRGVATHMLAVRHRDRVGVLAGVLDALREAGINVQEMENVLFAGGKAACARIQLDHDPLPAVIESIRKSSEHVLAVSVTGL